MSVSDTITTLQILQCLVDSLWLEYLFKVIQGHDR